MADKVLPGPVDSSVQINEAVCIHTRKVYDSCRDKDCIEDLRVYPTAASQPYIDCALSIRPRCAELLYVDVKVEEICFNRGYYTVDVTYYYKIRGEAYPSGGNVVGLSVFTKRAILYGGDGSVKVFSSDCGGRSAQPVAVVEAVDPVVLAMKLVDADCGSTDTEIHDVPACILEKLGEEIVFSRSKRMLLVTLGQFSLIRLERDTQLLVPTYCYCFPDKECAGSCPEEDPCTLFSRIPFPMDEFFPPDAGSAGGPSASCDCGCE